MGDFIPVGQSGITRRIRISNLVRAMTDTSLSDRERAEILLKTIQNEAQDAIAQAQAKEPSR
jgi:hypothetical protein